jgi:large subunit ribosomal protein L32e
MTTDSSPNSKAISLRKSVKKGKPQFKRHESWRYKRLSKAWRRPRGLDNKMRFEVKGWPKTVKIGYRGPKSARGLHPSGYKEILVHKPDDIVEVNAETQAIRIAHAVGIRKRILITSIAREREIHVLNPLVRKLEEERIEEEELPEELTEDIQGLEPEEEDAPEETSSPEKGSES